MGRPNMLGFSYAPAGAMIRSNLIDTVTAAAMKATNEVGGEPPSQPAGTNYPASPITASRPAAGASEK